MAKDFMLNQLKELLLTEDATKDRFYKKIDLVNDDMHDDAKEYYQKSFCNINGLFSGSMTISHFDDKTNDFYAYELTTKSSMGIESMLNLKAYAEQYGGKYIDGDLPKDVADTFLEIVMVDKLTGRKFRNG